MTERFIFEIKTQGNKAYTQWYDNEKPINSAETLCGLLNELHEENTMLKLQVETKLFSRRELEKENEQLKAQLLYDGDGVCNICKHQCLVKTEKYYVAKCEKEHEECSKVDLQYCEDFELVRDYE